MVPQKAFIASSSLSIHPEISFFSKISPSASQVVVVIPSVPSAIYFFRPSKKKDANFALSPNKTGNNPEAKGSNAPACPPLFALKIPRTRAKADADESPEGLFKRKTPLTSRLGMRL